MDCLSDSLEKTTGLTLSILLTYNNVNIMKYVLRTLINVDA